MDEKAVAIQGLLMQQIQQLYQLVDSFNLVAVNSEDAGFSDISDICKKYSADLLGKVPYLQVLAQSLALPIE